MKQVRKFLVIDDNPEARFLITKTLQRKFPKSILRECTDVDTSVASARKEKFDAIVLHRAFDADATQLIRELRAVSPEVPIVAVSGYNRAQETLAAGATRFHSYDEWLRIGSVVAEVLGLGNGDTPQPPFPVSEA